MKLLLIDVLDPDHIYSAFARALAKGLAACGAEVERVAFDGGFDGVVEALATRGCAAAISFSSLLGAAHTDGGSSIYDLTGVAFVGWHFDHPLYVSHHFRTPIARRISIFPSRHHLRFLQAAQGFGGLAAIGLSGAEPAADPASGPPPTAWKARPRGVLVQATWNGEPERVWAALEPSPGRDLLDGLADRLLEDPEVSLIDAWTAETAARGLTLDYDEGSYGLMRAALNFVRRVDRVRIVRALAASSLPVTVCGDGWEGALAARPGLEILPSLPFDASRMLYAGAKAAVGLNAANGGCERQLYGAAAGACVLSDASPDLAEALRPGVEMQVYDRTRPASVVEAAERALDPDAGEAMAEAGRARALAQSSWTARAGALLKLLEMQGLQ